MYNTHEFDGLNLTLPDIAREERVELNGVLDRVGMSDIEVPVILSGALGWSGSQQAPTIMVPARAEAYVSLDDPQAKGIHMSRLFLQLQEGLTSGPLKMTLLSELLGRFIDTHRELSHRSSIAVQFDYLIERPALKSTHKGWRSYPIRISGVREGTTSQMELAFKVVYSSTCPCSAALARQLIQDQFRKDFLTGPSDFNQSTSVSEAEKSDTLRASDVLAWLSSPKGIVATPHSQRSVAEVKLRFHTIDKVNEPSNWIHFIDRVEQSLGTPVQAAVKREDEQEFALINGQNLMFCEDAARKIKNTLNQEPNIADYWVKVSHLESLHPHDAVSVVTKGLKSGYQA